MTENKKILIVDDEAGFTRVLKIALEKAGPYVVETENNGLRAVQTALNFKPDIIFLDVVMPEIDGGDVASQIRAVPALAKIPIVFITAIVSPNETGRSENAIGGFTFLSKPVSLETLIRHINHHTNPPPGSHGPKGLG